MSVPLQVVLVGALYVQNFSIFRKLKTNYNCIKIIFHFNSLPYMFTENEIQGFLYYFDINYPIVPTAAI